MINIPGLSALYQNRLLGIDLGSMSIKAIELENNNGILRVANHALLENFGQIEAVISGGSIIIDEAEEANLVKWMIEQAKIKTKRVIMAVPTYSAFTSLIEMPPMSEGEINKAVPYEARQYVPMAYSEVALDWIIIKEGFGNLTNRTMVFLIAVPKDVIERYKRIASLAGLNLTALELENLSLLRAVVGNNNSALMIVELGAKATRVTSVSGGYVYFTRSIDVAGNSITAGISQGVQIDPIRAEELKRQRGLQVLPQETELKGLMIPFIDTIIIEIKKEIETFEKRLEKKVEKIIFTGGGALLNGLLPYFSSSFADIELLIANPFEGILVDQNAGQNILTKAPRFCVAIGLAKKELK